MSTNLTLVTLRSDTGYGLGVKTERGILDIAEASARLGLPAPRTVDEALAARDAAALDRLVREAASAAAADRFYIEEAKAAFGPCVTNPEKIICVGLNYRRHAVETGNPIPTVPILFNKYNNALSHHGAIVEVSRVPAEQFDYEAELVVVIGRTARNVPAAQALSYVAGYCVGNDLSVRDLQMKTSQWMLGKTCDRFAPIGPYLVGAGQVPDPNRLKIECRVNGEVRQSSNTADMVFSCAELVAYISRYFTLKPGDLIFTGTPEGVILGYPKEKRVWLRPGDRVSTSIERLGTLEFSLA